MYTIAFFDLNPVHIGIVLLLALLLFGPNKLPEMGQQLGRALRELKKAGSDLTNSFNLDHEPEHKPYDYGYPPYDDQNSSYGELAAMESKTDLTDYTIAGQPVKDTVSHNGAVMHDAVMHDAVMHDKDYATATASVPQTSTEAVAASEPAGHTKEG
jgi:sec-independent protein translocase protein TatA